LYHEQREKEMTLIGENLHIISPTTKEAIIARDEAFVLDLIKKQFDAGVDCADLNIGPAKAKLEGAMGWLVELIVKNFGDVSLSLDTTSAKELEEGFSLLKGASNCFLNSATADEARLLATAEIAHKYGANLIALTLDNTSGIPKTSDERLELALSMLEVINSKGIENEKVYFDPLVLPVCVEQSQALTALEAIRMFKESFDPEVKTIVGLSNVSNGCSAKNRALINRVFLALALGSGLDAAILDAFDKETLKVYNDIKGGKNTDSLYFKLYEMSKNLTELEEISYNEDETHIFKTAQILLNRQIYTHSFLDT
jgi:5-methyltetrahydrofolate corrinoid/iron sulfur protein methyltransferase